MRLLSINIICLLINSFSFGQSEGSYFPGKVAPGLEITRNFNFGQPDRMEWGLNVVLTSWHNLEENLEGNTLKNENFGLYQFGITASYSETEVDFTRENPEIGIVDRATLKMGLIYNRIAVENRSLGFTTRVNSINITTPDGIEGNLFDNFYLQPEVGITWMGIVNLTYGRTIPVNGLNGAMLSENVISFKLTLNPSYFMFGLQGF